MKAVLTNGVGGPDVLHIGETEKPWPGEGQVLIRVMATSVNRPDIVQREGHYPALEGESEILGLEVAGVVDAVGPNVSQWQTGDRVMALVGGGGYAEFAVAYAEHAMPIPHAMNFNEAACVCEAYITAYLNLFMIGNLQDGETVLLHGGGGGVNTAAIQLCQALTPKALVMVTASPRKIEGVRELGVDRVIDYTQGDFTDKVREFTDNKGARVILDHIGAAYLTSNMKALAVGGKLVIIGVTGGAKAELNLAVMMVKRQQVIGSVLRARSVEEKAYIIDEFSNTVLSRLADRTITPLIHTVFALEEVKQAHRVMEAGSHFGKIVLSLAT